MTCHGSASHRIFEVPELLDFICKSSSVRARARLLRVSRLFFTATAPLVWEDVTGADHLLRLLPNVIVTLKPTDSPHSKRTLIINANSFSSHTVLGRFNYYASLVKHLEVYPSSGTDYQILGWRRLLKNVDHQVLLPNLTRLTVSHFPLSGHEQFFWIRTFLSPSLSAIQVIPTTPERLPTISGLVAASLLGQIIKVCPDLRNISLFPSNTQPGASESNGYAIADFCDNSFYERLSVLRLCKLSCTTKILSPDWIHVLDGLPLLEHLDVYSVACAIAGSKTYSLPSLKQFGLYSTDWHELTQIWALDLFASLTSLEISFREDDFDDESDDDDSWEIAFVSMICQHSPALASISIDFGPTEFELDTVSLLNPMAKLPLTHLCFKSLSSMDDEVVEGMVTLFPMVTKLEFPSLIFTFKELPHLAKLQYLQHLVLGLSGDTRDINLDSSSIVSHSLHTLEICSEVDLGPDISLLARYLLSLWPNLQRVHWPELEGVSWSARASDMAVAEALNGFISSHRDMSHLKTWIINQYGVGALDKLSR